MQFRPSPLLVISRIAATIVLASLCVAVRATGAATFSGQGIVYSASTGGDRITVDRNGYAYVFETGTCPDTPSERPGIYEGYATGGRWLVKLDRDARTVVYRVLLGCPTSGFVGAIVATDDDGSAYVAGSMTADGSSVNPVSTARVGFVTKFDASGARIYDIQIAGVASAAAIAIDPLGAAYVTGSTNRDGGLQTTANAYQTAHRGEGDAFVLKIDPAGTRLVYSTYLGGTGSDNAAALAIDDVGNVFVGGVTWSEDFPTTPGAYQSVYRGSGDAFVLKLDSTGSRVLFSTYLGGTKEDYLAKFAVDPEGHAYVAGSSWSADFPTTPGALNQPADHIQPFVTKLNTSGTGLVYSGKFGGPGTYFSGFAVNAAREVYVAGTTASDAIPTTADAPLTHNAGASDAWIVKLDGGGALVYGTYLGGPGYDRAEGLALDPSGTAYLFGETDATGGFPITPRAIQAEPQGQSDAFVTAIDNSGRIRYSSRIGGAGQEWWIEAAVDAIGDVYLTGYSGGDGQYDVSWTSDFPLTPETVATGVVVDIEHRPARGFVTKLVPRASFSTSAFASSIENASLGALNAIDGVPQTRWSSAFHDGESVYIDLGQPVLIDRIVLNWETAYGSAYEIRVADSGFQDDGVQSWLVYSTATGDGGIDDLRNLGVRARYVWLFGVHRATPWGFSLWDVAVYGTPAETRNYPPTIQAITPVSGSVFVGPLTLDVATQVADSDGTVTQVMFYIDGRFVAIDRSAPFGMRTSLVAGRHTIAAIAVDDDGARSLTAISNIDVRLPQPGLNLALGRPVYTSSIESSALAAANAVDGSATTRWSSAFSDPQWIYVDLGSRFAIDTVVLQWETAYAGAFDVEVSDDALTWNDVYTTGTGTGGVQALRGLYGWGRYVRVYGRERATRWGYSLYEIEVYGTPSSEPVNIAARKPTFASSIENSSLTAEKATDGLFTTRWSSAFRDNQWIAVDLGSLYEISHVVLRWETAYASEYALDVSIDGSNWRTVQTRESSGGTDYLDNLQGLARYVRVYALQRGTQWGVSLWEFEVYGSGAALTQNLAPTAASVTASSIERPELAPRCAIDRDLQTRWSTAFADNQWLSIDLGATVRLRRLVLTWETAYASSYSVQASADGETWQTVWHDAAADGGIDDLSVDAYARYVRVLCNTRATEWGFSIWEVEIYAR